MSAQESDKKVKELEQLNAQLLEQNQALSQMGVKVVELERINQQLNTDLIQAKAHIAELTRQLFGQKADKLSPEQEQMLKDVVEDVQEQLQRPTPISRQCLEEELDGQKQSKPRTARSRYLLPTTLETVTVTLEPEFADCPPGNPPRKIGEEVTQELDFIPPKLILRRIVRPKYVLSGDEGTIVIAPLPPRLFPQSKLGLGLAVFIALSRYDDNLSFYKLEQNFQERYGVTIPRQQMVQWVEQIALWLQPIYNAMWQLMRDGDYLQIDETTVKVLDPEVKGKAATGYLWFYSVPGADVIVEFNPSRGQAAPKAKLEGFKGAVQADAYEVYPCIERDLPGIKRLGCLAHSRRRFYKAALEGDRQAIWFIGQIRNLYRIERDATLMAAEDRHRYRQEKNAAAIWQEMKTKAEELQTKHLPQSSLGKAVRYYLNEYEPLVRYLEDGKYLIDNNLCENSIRPVAVGRKRWLFLGHPDAAWRSAVIYSIIMSCRRRGINPQDYLTDVLSRLPAMKSSEIKNLVPEIWKPKAADTG
jgi:transposase